MNLPSDRDRILEARRIVSRLPGQAERELEQVRLPFSARRKLIHPHAEIGSEALDVILPDPIDSRGEDARNIPPRYASAFRPASSERDLFEPC